MTKSPTLVLMEDDKNSSFSDFIGKSKENIKNTRENILNSLEGEGNQNIFAAISYIPVFGIIINYLFKKDQKFTMAHTKNAAYIQLTFIAIGFTVWFLVNMPLISSLLKALMFIPIITNAILYVNTIFLWVSLGIGAFNAYQSKIWEIPYLYNWIDTLLNKKGKASKK